MLFEEFQRNKRKNNDFFKGKGGNSAIVILLMQFPEFIEAFLEFAMVFEEGDGI